MSMIKVAIPAEDYYQNLISCQVACPVHTDARGYVRAIAEGRFEEAYLIARGPNPFASICGRICGAPCEVSCRRGKVPRVNGDGSFAGEDRPIAIRALKGFACSLHGPETQPVTEVLRNLESGAPPLAAGPDEFAALLRSCMDKTLIKANGELVAIIGAGPAGLSAAHDLALLGFAPVVFESEPAPAGMLIFGVPAYRLPREWIAREIDVIRALGVEIRCGVNVGKEISFAEIRRDFKAVIIAVGAKSSRSLGIPGERGPGVYGGVDLLRAVELQQQMDIGREVLVIGGGNVAYDVARTVLRQIALDTARTAARLAGTASVKLASLEGLEEMPADTLEILEGDEEGIERLNGWGPLEIMRSQTGAVTGVAFRKCLRVYDDQRRFAPVFAEQQKTMVPCETVLLAVGQAPNLAFLEDGGSDIEQLRPGWPRVNPKTLAATAAGVFIAGDLAHGTRLLIDAVASGKAAARSVYEFLTGRKLAVHAESAHLILDRYRREKGYESVRRVPVAARDPAERMHRPDTLVELGYSEQQARREASRCLDCGVTPIFDGTRCVLCGGCVDVCPTLCLKLVPLDKLEPTDELRVAVETCLGALADFELHSAILKDEDRCIRCAACAMRCPVDAITMERVSFNTKWRNV